MTIMVSIDIERDHIYKNATCLHINATRCKHTYIYAHIHHNDTSMDTVKNIQRERIIS